MQKLIIVESAHGVPEDQANYRLSQLDDNWKVVSATTICSMVDTTRSGGSDKMYVTTIVVSGEEKEKKKKKN